jgi:UDP-N-acetylglucosamine 4-epimerase
MTKQFVIISANPCNLWTIPHSLASVEKAKQVLGYNPKYDVKKGFELACNLV